MHAQYADHTQIVTIEEELVERLAEFAPHMLYIVNEDKPGFIGALGVMLGDANVNIATFNLGRQNEGEEAVALVGIDSDISADLLKKICALPHVRYVQVLKF